MRARDGSRRLPNWAIGLAMVVILAIASFLAFAKELPWASKHEVQAVFASTSNIRPDSPVRIAGVNVGKVASIEHLAPDDPELTAQLGESAPSEDVPETASVVTMELEESALPLHTDATMKLRPRLFLEGNLFVDLKPGSPNAPVAEEGHVFPAGQTSIAVQLDQILTTLQSDVRSDLQTLLNEFGNALDKYDGSAGLRELYRTSPGAFRYTSEVNEALLGTEPGDLSDLIVNLDSTVEALGRNEGDLQDLVTNLRVVLGSFAAESEALRQGIAELPRVLEEGEPALASLNAAFPSLRAFAREALPGVRSTPATLDAATPFLRQLRGLVSKDELRGLVADLRPTIPDLARLSRTSIPLLRQSRLLSSCVNEVFVPFSNMIVPDPEHPTLVDDSDPSSVAKVYQELTYALSIGGESRSGDANGQPLRVNPGGGRNTIVIPEGVRAGAGEAEALGVPLGSPIDAVGATPLEIQGARPSLEQSAKTPYRPDARCERQEPPNLDSGEAVDLEDAGIIQEPVAAPDPQPTEGLLDAAERFNDTSARAADVRGERRQMTAARRVDGAMHDLSVELARTFGIEDLLGSLLEAPGS